MAYIDFTFKGKKQTEGGILLPDQAIEREALATVCGYVLKNWSTSLQRFSKNSATHKTQPKTGCLGVKKVIGLFLVGMLVAALK